MDFNIRKLLMILQRKCQYFFFQRILGINGSVPWPAHWTSNVFSHSNISLSQGMVVGMSPGCYINAHNGIIFGKNVRIGPGVKIISANHNLYDYSQHDPCNPIHIADNCWIGANAVILPGVYLKEHTIVGAGAVVTKSFPEGNCILGGVPAQVIKKIGEYKNY